MGLHQLNIPCSNMASAIEFICTCSLVFGLCAGQSQVIQSTAPVTPHHFYDGEKGNCTCGGFSSSTINENSKPLLSQAPGIAVKCDDTGEAVCKNLCIALATAAEARGPEMLCARLKDANELKLSAFYKTCDRPWLYADMSAHEPLCCENESVKVCASAEAVTNTTFEPKGI